MFFWCSFLFPGLIRIFFIDLIFLFWFIRFVSNFLLCVCLAGIFIRAIVFFFGLLWGFFWFWGQFLDWVFVSLPALVLLCDFFFFGYWIYFLWCFRMFMSPFCVQNYQFNYFLATLFSPKEKVLRKVPIFCFLFFCFLLYYLWIGCSSFFLVSKFWKFLVSC